MAEKVLAIYREIGAEGKIKAMLNQRTSW